MRLAGVSTIDQANLRDFLPRFNRSSVRIRQLPPSTCLDAVLCFKYIRTVERQHGAIRRHHNTTPARRPQGQLRSANVHVERLDGSIVVAYQGRTLAAVPVTGRPCPAQGTERPPTQRPFALRLGSRRLQWHSCRLSAGTERRPSRATHPDHKPPNAPAPQEDQHQTTPGGE